MIVAHAPAPVKSDTGVIAVTPDGQLFHLSLKFDSAGHCWRLTRPGDSQTSLVYKIGGLAGRPRRVRCTCVDALLTRTDDELQGDDDCGHVQAIAKAGLLTILDMSIHPSRPGSLDQLADWPKSLPFDHAPRHHMAPEYCDDEPLGPCAGHDCQPVF